MGKVLSYIILEREEGGLSQGVGGGEERQEHVIQVLLGQNDKKWPIGCRG